MKPLRNAFLIIFLIGSALAACAPVQFATRPAAAVSCNSSGRSCSTSNGLNNFDYSVQAPAATSDILFVVDNSASMSVIQHQIAQRFANFIQSLGSMDYRIALTTTDINATAGNLLPMRGGSYVLTPSTLDAQAVFAEVIERRETQACDSNNPAACPSQDTRAIYAANLAVQRADAGFLRPSVPLAVIIVSNADERACAGQSGCPYTNEAGDDPSSLRQTVAQTFSSTKSLTVHSIIIAPGDQGCYDIQHQSQDIYGWFGYQYAQLSQMTGGVVRSVCESDYAAQLGQIGGRIANSVTYLDLSCAPVPGSLMVDLMPYDSSANPQINGTRIQFSHALAASTSVRLRFSCKAT